MKESNLENKIIDYLNNELSSKERSDFEQLLNTDNQLKNKYEEFNAIYNTLEKDTIGIPPSEIKSTFESFLAAEIEISSNGNSMSQSNYKKYFGQGFLFLMLLGVGLFLGVYSQSKQNETEVIHFAEYENYNDKANLLSLLEQKSTSKRIQAVNMSNFLKKEDDGILDALIRTFHNDKSDHVRLACIESLSKYTDQPKVRDAFIKALDEEEDPTLQIALINVLSEIKEQKAVQSFDKIIQNDQSVNFVRDEAYSGKLKLINTY